MSHALFEPWPKMARLSRECVITEKIDGTNAQVFIFTEEELTERHKQGINPPPIVATDPATGLMMCAGSRTRWIIPNADNMGFARWVEENATELFKLGPGRHFGEWWGSKVQRGYGQPPGVKHFSLFNTKRWHQMWCAHKSGYETAFPKCCSVVPILYYGTFTTEIVESALASLQTKGSVAAPGFMDPEGVVVYHIAAGVTFKKTLHGDAKGGNDN